jgi:hypothetical protein
MTTIETRIDRRKDVQAKGSYDIYLEIDIDCEELVDACGLEYKQCEDDDTQNEILLSLTKDEYLQATEGFNWALLNEVDIGSELLNYELGEYVTKVTIYKPSGDIISFC